MAISLSHQRSILLFAMLWVTTVRRGLINTTEVFHLILLKHIIGIPLTLWPVLLDHYNPDYQFVHSGYKKIRELTNLTDEDLLLSLEKIDEIGLILIQLAALWRDSIIFRQQHL